MLGVVPASQDDLVCVVVAAESWRAATGAPVVVVVDHPDLVRPYAAALPGARVLSTDGRDVPGGLRAAVLKTALADATPGTACVLLPPSAMVLASPDRLVEAARDAGVAIAVRGRGALPEKDGDRPSAGDIAGLGPLHGELLAVRAGDARTAAFLDWLAATPDEAQTGLVGVRQPDVALVDDPGTGVGWWNLAERPLTVDDDRLSAAGRAVSVVDLAGWDPRYPHMLHPDMTRLRASADPALRWVVDRYAAAYAEAEDRFPEPVPPVWPDDPSLRELLLQAPAGLRISAIRDEPGGREAYARWAEETDEEDTVWGLSRYLLAFRRGRHDLQVAFPDVNDGATARRYLEWARVDGVTQGIPERFVGPVPSLDDAAPPSAVRPRDTSAGVNVIGMFEEPALGVAEIARQVRDGFEAAGVQVAAVTVDRRGRPVPAEGNGPLPFDTTIACVNADLLPVVHARLVARLPERGRLAGLWWWELSELPSSWDAALQLVDEVWAGTRFVARAFEAAFDGPARLVPLGLGRLGEAGSLPDRVAADERPYVLVTFDYASRIERKNPLGAIEAFVRSGLAPAVRLVIKTVNGGRWPREQELVRLAVVDAGPQDILLLDEAVSGPAQAALVEHAVAHLALHRSEGLGLTIVEAMMRGTPVVATDFGGSTDVLDGDTGWPVPYTDATVPENCDPYPAGAVWAEPDIDAAARALREVWEGGSVVAARTAEARVRTFERAQRVASGVDLVAALRASREKEGGGRVLPGPRGIGSRLRRGR